MRSLDILTYEEIDAYRKNGYLVVRGAFTQAEVALLRAECDRLLTLKAYVDPRNIRSGHRSYDGGRTMVEKLDPVHDISPVLTDLVRDERILTPLRDIYLDEPRLFKDKLIFKLPGASGYSMHQDAGWWQGFPYQDLISVMVAIDGSNADNGAVELFSGYHDQLRTTPGEMRNFTDEETATIDEERGSLIETRPGDLLIFHSLVPHRSGPNQSDRSRTQLYLTYSPARAGELYRAHYQHYQRYAVKGEPVDGARLYFT